MMIGTYGHRVREGQGKDRVWSRHGVREGVGAIKV